MICSIQFTQYSVQDSSVEFSSVSWIQCCDSELCSWAISASKLQYLYATASLSKCPMAIADVVQKWMGNCSPDNPEVVPVEVPRVKLVASTRVLDVRLGHRAGRQRARRGGRRSGASQSDSSSRVWVCPWCQLPTPISSMYHSCLPMLISLVFSALFRTQSLFVLEVSTSRLYIILELMSCSF